MYNLARDKPLIAAMVAAVKCKYPTSDAEPTMQDVSDLIDDLLAIIEIKARKVEAGVMTLIVYKEFTQWYKLNQDNKEGQEAMNKLRFHGTTSGLMRKHENYKTCKLVRVNTYIDMETGNYILIAVSGHTFGRMKSESVTLTKEEWLAVPDDAYNELVEATALMDLLGWHG